jgi:hypothetical protein
VTRYAGLLVGSPGSVNGDRLTTAIFNAPYGIMVNSSSGVVYTTDQGSFRIRKIDESGQVNTLAGKVPSGKVNSVLLSAKFRTLGGLVLDNTNNLVVADIGNNILRYVDLTAGQVTANSYSGAVTSGTGAETGGSSNIAPISYNQPTDITKDSTGTYLYVADTSNCLIRKIDLNTSIVSNFAGTAICGNVGNQLNLPTGLVFGNNNDLYVADGGNYRVVKVDSTGGITLFAGSGVPGVLDGSGVLAGFGTIKGIAFHNGNLYVSDTSMIRKITSSGVVSTFAGSTTTGGADGVGTAATFTTPAGLSVYNNTLYVADMGNHLIRTIYLV